MKQKNIILGITGSIAAYKACDLIRLLRKAGFNVICVLTKEAEHFVTPLTLETLSGNKVLGDIFALPENRSPQHISLAEKADAFVICPASANTISKLAQGICDDLLTCTIFATRAPVLIAPAMNNNMYNHKIIKKNVAILENIGYNFVGPIKGRLASGHYGIGHLADVTSIFSAVKKLVK